jgi:hypothetical protein
MWMCRTFCARAAERVSGVTNRMIKSGSSMERPREIPWPPLAKPLSECTVSLISSAGIALKSDRPCYRSTFRWRRKDSETQDAIG